MRLLLISLLLSFALTNCPTETTEVVDMTATVNPEEAGVVNPPEGSYLAGREITVVTEATDDRWEFVGWSGDTTATDDSLTFTITRDMDLVANYEIPADAVAFENQITVTDGTNNSMDLIFGMNDAATSGFDSNIDRELPPPPPDGFYAQFTIPDFALAEDYRAISEQTTIWELEFAPDAGQTISLSWDFSNSAHLGSLMLTDDPESPSFEIDMKSETSYQVSDSSVEVLYIISN